MLELGRWGMGLQRAEDVIDLAPASLPNALRVIFHPPDDFRAVLGLRSGGQSYQLSFGPGGWIEASRGAPAKPDLTLVGTPLEVIATLLDADAAGAEVEGDRALLEQLREMLVIPERLREEALAALPALAGSR
jgi:hypothetical protein